MSSLKTIRKVLFKARDNAKVILAVFATLIFGASTVFFIGLAFDESGIGIIEAARSGHFLCMIKHQDEGMLICDGGSVPGDQSAKQFYATGQRSEQPICTILQQDHTKWENGKLVFDWAEFRVVGPQGQVQSCSDKDEEGRQPCVDAAKSWNLGECAKCGESWTTERGEYVSPIDVTWGENFVTINELSAVNYWPWVVEWGEPGLDNAMTHLSQRGSTLDFHIKLLENGTEIASKEIRRNDNLVEYYYETLKWKPRDNPPQSNNQVAGKVRDITFNNVNFKPGLTYSIKAYTRINEMMGWDSDLKNRALDWQTSNNCISEYTPTVPPGFSCLSKSATPSESYVLTPGDWIDYSVEYSVENVDVPGVYIIDNLPSGIIIDKNSITGANNCHVLNNDTILQCTATSNGTLSFRAQVDPNFTGTEIVNTAVVNLPGSGESYCNEVHHTIQQPGVTCESKTVSDQAPEIGDIITYTIAYSAIQEPEDITIRDTLNTNIEPILPLNDNCGWDSNTREIECVVIAPYIGDTDYLQFNVEVTGSGIIGNTATVIGSTNDTDTCSVDIEVPVPQPKLVCDSKTIDKNEVQIGDVVTFSINYSNTGNATAESIFALEDDLGDGYVNLRNFRIAIGNTVFTLDTCSEGNLMNGGCTTPDVSTGENASLLFEADVVSIDDLENSAHLIYNNGTSTNACPFIPPTPIWPIVDCVGKTAEHEYSEDIKVGDTVTYTISYSSLNQPEGELVTISDLLDVNLEFVGFENGAESYCTYNNDTREITCSVPGNQTGELSYSAVIINDGTITNQAIVTDNYGHSESKGCKVDFDARPLREELICVSKEADNNYMNYGDEGDFVITYQNTGETELDGITLHDTLPVGMEFVSAEDDLCRVLTPEELVSYGPAVYDSNRDTIRCEGSNILQPREKATFRFTIRIRDDAPAGDSVVNEVSSLLSEEVQGDVSACTEEVFINLPKPSVIVEKETKSPADRTMVLGDDAETLEDHVRFLITVTNNGPTKLKKVPLYDKFYADDYEFVSANPAPDTDEYIPATRPLVKLFWNDLGELNPGESTVVEVVLRALETHSADKLINYTKVEDAVDENGVLVDSNIDDDYVIIEGSILGEQLNFNIVKTLVTENPTKEGEVVKFHIVITNTGTKTIEKIKLVDDYDINYLEFTDFSAKISHDSSLYSVNAEDGVFTHLNILSGVDFLEPGEEMDMDIWFLAKNKKGETINLAEATIDDLVDFDTAKVTIVVEELADTGSNILAILVIGVVLSCFGVVGVNYIKKKR